jgi:hypothetical protein
MIQIKCCIETETDMETELLKDKRKETSHLQPGDVINVNGLQIVTLVNSCRAVIRPMESSKRTFTPKLGDKEVTITEAGRSSNISPNSDVEIIEQRGEIGLKKFLESKKPKPKEKIVLLEAGDIIGWNGIAQCVFAISAEWARIAKTGDFSTTIIEREQNEFLLLDKPRLDPGARAHRVKQFLAEAGDKAGELTKEITPDEMEQTMSKKTKKNVVKATKPAKEKKPDDGSRGGLGNCMGFSVSSVIRKLGQEGLDADQIDRALKSQGVTADPKTIKVSIRKVVLEDKTKKFADLSKKQLATLVKDAGEPAAPKEKKSKSRKGEAAAAA